MTLPNKFGITDLTELEQIEERTGRIKALELYESGYLDTLNAGTYQTLSDIHRYLFQEIYEFAGNMRGANIINHDSYFTSVMFLRMHLDKIEAMPQSTFDEIIEKYVNMNVAHPFREGNGRCIRIWLDLILKKEIGQVINWGLVDKNDYFLALERSFTKDIELKYLLGQALTDHIDDREIYIKSILFPNIPS